MVLRFQNTLSKRKDEFIPLTKGRVGMYVCGVTPYDQCHIGHARAGVVFDVVNRYLRFKGYDVKYVTNFTDVDDKIIQRANELKTDPFKLAQQYIDEYFTEFDALGVKRADVYCKATEHIIDMIRIIEGLVAKGYAYEVGGDVFFEVKKFKDYGRLSGQPLSELIAGARVEVSEKKRNPEDFALWKAAKPGEPSWDSPWGKGRPGWHIECSAMSMKYLGESFDIHGGGADLVFPHHENEIAQSEAFTEKRLSDKTIRKPFARYWLHNGMVTVDGEKMAKSAGNFVTLADALKKYDAEVLRYFLVSTHYRSPLDFTEERMEIARNSLQRFYDAYFDVFQEIEDPQREEVYMLTKEEEIVGKLRDYRRRFEEAMDDDINTPQALSELFRFRDGIYAFINDGSVGKNSLRNVMETYKKLLFVLGLLERAGERLKARGVSSQAIQELIRRREQLRDEGKYGEADAIRNQLKEKNISLEDTPRGVRWKIAI